MQITPHVFQVGGSDISAPPDAAVYLIKSGNTAALVDGGTGEGHNEILMNIRECGVEPSSIACLFITHCHYDHTGGVAALKEATGCTLVAHQLDAIYLETGDSDVTAASWYGSFMKPFPVDIKVHEKERSFTLGDLTINMYHIPGHSPGSAAFTLRSNGNLVLFGQDVHGPLNDMLKSNREHYEKSLEFMISLEADILCEGHFGVYQGKERVERFIQSFL